MTSEFKVGDIVRIAPDHERAASRWSGKDLTVTSVQSTGAKDVFWVGVRDHEGFKDTFYSFRFERVSRTPGAEIKRDKIQVGDRIKTTFTSGSLTITREGEVDHIDESGRIWTDDRRRLDVDPDETYTLVKAAPTNDPVREKLRHAKDGDVLEFHTKPSKAILARKSINEGGGTKWVVFYPSGQCTMSQKAFAEEVRTYWDTVRWLA